MPEASIDEAPQLATKGAPPPDPAPRAGENIAEVQENAGVSLARMAWLVTTVVCLIAAAVALVDGYRGYAAVAFAVAISAGINLL